MAAWLKALLFVAGGVTAAGGVAYVTGVLDPWLGRAPATVAALPQADEPDVAAEPAPAADAEQPADEPEPEPEAAQKQPRLPMPAFDLVRVERDGSVVVAGTAAPEARIELMLDETVLGETTVDGSGDFAIVLDDRLPAGDHVLALRATAAEGGTVLSSESAIVSIPGTDDGQVLVMVEEPGAPADLLSVPEAAAEPADGEDAAPDVAAEPTGAEDIAAATAPEPAAAPDEEAVAEDAGTAPADAGEEIAAARPDAPADAGSDVAAAPEPDEPASLTAVEEEAATAPSQPSGPAATSRVAVEAVEIEGDTVFVAGHAEPGRTVRIYAGEILLGDALSSPEGRFLVEARRDLPVGNHVIRADLLDGSGSVLARAAVPFERESGETVAAVAAPAREDTTPASEPEATDEEAAAASEPGAAAEAAREEAVAAAPAPQEEMALTAPPLQRADRSVIIRRGDNLWRISRRVYGKGVRYSTIYLANRDQIEDPDRIWPGQVFALPQQTEEGEAANMDAISGQLFEPGEESAGER